jgi:hypothetical protein
MLPETPFTVNVPVLIEAALMASLKVKLIAVPVATPVAPFEGLVEETVGGVVSPMPLPPGSTGSVVVQAASRHAVSISGRAARATEGGESIMDIYLRGLDCLGPPRYRTSTSRD